MTTKHKLFDYRAKLWHPEPMDGSIILSDGIPEHEQRCLGIDCTMRLRRSPSAETNLYLQEHRRELYH